MEHLLDTKAAAQYLHDQIPDESMKYWAARLNNLRRTDRPQPFALQFSKVEGKSGFYSREDLAAYVEFEKARRVGKVKLSGRAAEALRAYGIGEQGGGVHGRKLSYDINVQVNEGDPRPYVQLIINEPFLVYRIPADELTTLVKELSEAKTYIDQFKEAQ